MFIHERTLGDTQLPITAQLLDEEGDPVDLTGKTVTFSMYDHNGTVIVNNAAATVTGAATGDVAYDFAADEVDEGSTPDTPNKGYFHVLDGSSEPQTYPPDGIDIIIYDPARDITPTVEIDIAAAANTPKRVRTEEGTVEERSIADLIEADKYIKQSEADGPPWGIRMARIQPGGTLPRR